MLQATMPLYFLLKSHFKHLLNFIITIILLLILLVIKLII